MPDRTGRKGSRDRVRPDCARPPVVIRDMLRPDMRRHGYTLEWIVARLREAWAAATLPGPVDSRNMSREETLKIPLGLFTPGSLDLRTINALEEIGVLTVGDLARKSDAQL